MWFRCFCNPHKLKQETIARIELQITACLQYSNRLETDINHHLCSIGLMQGALTPLQEDRVKHLIHEVRFLKAQLKRSRDIMRALVRQKHAIQQASLNQDIVQLLTDINQLYNSLDLNDVDKTDELLDTLAQNTAQFEEVNAMLAEDVQDDDELHNALQSNNALQENKTQLNELKINAPNNVQDNKQTNSNRFDTKKPHIKQHFEQQIVV